jgi:hypothetical protein
MRRKTEEEAKTSTNHSGSTRDVLKYGDEEVISLWKNEPMGL